MMKRLFFYQSVKQIGAFGSHRQGGAVVDLHRLEQMLHILHPRSLVAGMHGKLGKSNIRRGHGDLPKGDVAQGRTTGDIRPVVVGLHRDICQTADPAEHRRRLVDLHRLEQVLHILHPRSLVAGMHGKLGKPNIRRGHGDLPKGDVAQG